MSIDLKGNSNYTALRGLPTVDPSTGVITPGPYIVPRTALSAVDLIVTDGLSCSGDTLSLNIATSSDIDAGTSGKVITADVLKPYIDSQQTTLVEGTGIDITNSTISVSGVPQSEVTGLSASLAAKQDTISAGYRMEIVSGTTVAQQRYFDIETPTGATVSLQAGHAYRINITTAANAKTLVSEPDNVLNKFGLEGHAEIFVANTGYLHTDGSVVFADPLTPNAMNNCTLRFHDGECIISLEDHVYGYIVVQNDNTGEGSLYYALTNASLASQEYIAVSELLAGQTLALANANVTNNKHLVGNGYNDTIIGGTVSVAANKTFKVDAVSLNNVTVASGILTLSDAYIPSGSTVTQTATYAILPEKVTGGGVIDLKKLSALNGGGYTTLNISNITITGGTTNTNGGAIYKSASVLSANNVVFSGNSAGQWGGAICARVGAQVYLSGCTFTDNYEPTNGVLWADGGSIYDLTDCVFNASQGIMMRSAGLTGCNFHGSNKVDRILASAGGGTVSLAANTVINLTEASVAVPINPGNGVAVGSNVQILTTSGGSTKVTEISGGTYAKIANGQVNATYNPRGNVLLGPVALSAGESIVGGTNAVIDVMPASSTEGGIGKVGSGYVTNWGLSGVTLTGGNSAYGGVFVVGSGATATLTNCIIDNNSTGGAGLCRVNGTTYLSGCTVTANNTGYGVFLEDAVGAKDLTIENCTFEYQMPNSVYLAHGAILLSVAGTTGTVNFKGTNRFGVGVYKNDSTGVHNVVFSSGAILDCTGNSRATISDCEHNIFMPGGATIYPSAGSASAYVLDGLTVPKLRNDNVIDLTGHHAEYYISGYHYASNVTISGGTNNTTATTAARNGGAMNFVNAGSALFEHCRFEGNSAITSAAGMGIFGGAIYTERPTTFTNCVFFSNYSSQYGGALGLRGGATVSLTGCTFAQNATVINSYGRAIWMHGNTDDRCTLTLSNCVFSDAQNINFYGTNHHNITLAGTVATLGKIEEVWGTSNTINVASGAIINVSGNGNPIVISAGGGVKFASEGALVNYGTNQFGLSNFVVPYITNSNGITFPNGGHVVESGITGNQQAWNYTIISGSAPSGEEGGCLALKNTASGGSVAFASCTFSKGEAYGPGGGVYISGTSVYFGPTSIIDNHTNNNGGGLCVEAGSIIDARNCLVLRNAAGSAGGGIYLASGATATLGSGTSIMSNTAASGSDIYLNSTAVLKFSGGSADKVYLGSSGARVDFLSCADHQSSWIGTLTGEAGMYAGVVIENGASMYIADKIQPGGPITFPAGTVYLNGSACTFTTQRQVSVISNNNGTISYS